MNKKNGFQIQCKRPRIGKETNMDTLLAITLALLIVFIGGRIAVYFKYPAILGQFIISLFLATPYIKEVMFSPQTVSVIETFAELGVIFLLLLTGLESNLKKLAQLKKEVALITLFGTLTPLFSGFIAGMLFGLGWESALILGIALSVTAKGTNLAALLQLGKLKTRLGSILLGSGMLDDVFEIFFLTVVLALAHHDGLGTLFILPIKLILFTVVIWAASLLIPKILTNFEKKGKEITTFNVIILITLILSILSELAGLSAILGAFIAGLILQNAFKIRKDEVSEEHDIELFLFGFIIPFFFINIALNFDLSTLIKDPLLVLGVILISIAAKIVGILLSKPFLKLSLKQLYLIGWGMNSRGVMELIIVNIALQAGLISIKLYSAIVFMSVVTTVIFPFFLKRLIKSNPTIMN